MAEADPYLPAGEVDGPVAEAGPYLPAGVDLDAKREPRQRAKKAEKRKALPMLFTSVFCAFVF